MRWTLALLMTLAAGLATAGPAEDAAYACVRLPSHGASGTFIATYGPSADWPNGVSYILSCAHLDPEKGVKLTINAPAPLGERKQVKANPQFVAWNKTKDLSLIRIEVGPVPHVATVAPRGFQPGTLALSCGYDSMGIPGRRVTTHILGTDNRVTWTREKPWHGRSGGALLDSRTGHLVGVCEGYTIDAGMYRPLSEIHAFLDASGYGSLIPPGTKGGEGKPPGSRQEATPAPRQRIQPRFEREYLPRAIIMPDCGPRG